MEGTAKKAVTRFQVFQAFTDAEGFAYSIWPIVHTMKTREEFIELLNSEFTEKELQLIVTAAREERYPVSLERLQYLSRMGEEGIYRWAAYKLVGEGNYLEADSIVYAYEIEQLSDKPVHNAKEKIRARLKANLKLSLLLLEEGYEDAAVDNILKLFR